MSAIAEFESELATNVELAGSDDIESLEKRRIFR